MQCHITPKIETTETLSFDVRDSVSINNAIESSFGIDYHQIIIDPNVNAATVKMTIPETNRADYALQIWSFQNDVIIDSFNVVISDTVSIAAESFRTLNTANKLIINVTRLDTNEFNSAIDSTYTINVYPGTLVSGTQSGSWIVENSPYLMDGDITVAEGQTLDIDSGVSVYSLEEYGGAN